MYVDYVAYMSSTLGGASWRRGGGAGARVGHVTPAGTQGCGLTMRW